MQDGSASQSYDVVIVGRGPVGATLANLLGLCGVRTLVLEREARAHHLPRAVHFDDECMRVFQTIGLADAILPQVILSPGMLFLDANGRMLLDWSRPLTLTPQGWNLSYRFHQPDLEEVLIGGLQRWPHVTMRNRCDVFALDQDETGVRVRYEDLSNGQLAEVRAGYVIGCDGARSLVRRFIGSGMDDLGFHERWLVVDVLLKRARDDLGDYSLQHCDPRRPATYVRGTGTRRRWEITVLPDEVSQEVTQPAKVWELLSRWITPEDAELERAAVYTFHSTIAQKWRDGRLLLDGEAVAGPSRKVGVVFQAANLLPWMTVRDNVRLPLRVGGKHAPAADRIERLLAVTGLGEFGDKYPYELSGGMQQRAGICRALARDPEILLMDEPFGALDALTRERLNLELQRIWQENRKTILLITHSISEAIFLADRVIVMSARPGRILADLHVPIPRPRTFDDIVLHPDYARLAKEVRGLLNAQEHGHD